MCVFVYVCTCVCVCIYVCTCVCVCFSVLHFGCLSQYENFFTRTCASYWQPHYWRKSLSLIHQFLPVYKSSGRGRAPYALLHSMTGCWQSQFCEALVQAIQAAVSAVEQRVQKSTFLILLSVFPPVPIFFLSLLQCSLGVKLIVIHVPFIAGHIIVIYSLLLTSPKSLELPSTAQWKEIRGVSHQS